MLDLTFDAPEELVEPTNKTTARNDKLTPGHAYVCAYTWRFYPAADTVERGTGNGMILPWGGPYGRLSSLV